jgi:phosphoglycerate dehydrogenase-like enzyme
MWHSSSDCARSTSSVSCANGTPPTREILQQLPKLRFIASTGPRNASIDTQAAADLGIAVTATGYDSTPTIEFTWSMILASIRGIDRNAASLKAGGWQTGLGSNLRGKNLAVVGLGNIGREVARIGLAFGMKVIAWSQNLTEEKASAAGATLVDKGDPGRRISSQCILF